VANSLGQATVTTAHVALGSLILAVCALVAARSLRYFRVQRGALAGVPSAGGSTMSTSSLPSLVIDRPATLWPGGWICRADQAAHRGAGVGDRRDQRLYRELGPAGRAVAAAYAAGTTLVAASASAATNGSSAQRCAHASHAQRPLPAVACAVHRRLVHGRDAAAGSCISAVLSAGIRLPGPVDVGALRLRVHALKQRSPWNTASARWPARAADHHG